MDNLLGMENGELVEYVTAKVAKYMEQREMAVRPYGCVELRHLQQYKRYLERCLFGDEKAVALNVQLDEILAKDGGVTEAPKKKVLSVYEVHHKQNKLLLGDKSKPSVSLFYSR